MSDLISRKAAIGTLDDEITITGKSNAYVVKDYVQRVKRKMENLPSAQPEIVRCKDCKWYELPSHKIFENCVRWMKSNGILLPIKPNDYCSMAERREDGSD